MISAVTSTEHPNDVDAFTGMLRDFLPDLIDAATGGEVLQRGDRELSSWGRESAFEVELSTGACFQITVVQSQRAEVDDDEGEDEVRAMWR